MVVYFLSGKFHAVTLGKFCNTKHELRYGLCNHGLNHVFTKKENTMVGLIRRIFSYLDGPLFKKLFTTFLRLPVEYVQVKHINTLEKVQLPDTKPAN